MSILRVLTIMAAGLAVSVPAQTSFESDLLPAAEGGLRITFIGHGSLMFEFAGKTIHVDPCGNPTDYAKLFKADLILITHEHPDHLDAAAIREIRKKGTVILGAAGCASRLDLDGTLTNGATRTLFGVKVEAVPAYNLVHKRDTGQPFHPRGQGNGYVLTFGDKRVYVAGDTENIPEMKALAGIDAAFLPMNLPYTMTPEMVADAARAFKPRILYPYHYGETDPARLTELLKDVPGIEVRIRKLK